MGEVADGGVEDESSYCMCHSAKNKRLRRRKGKKEQERRGRKSLHRPCFSLPAASTSTLSPFRSWLLRDGPTCTESNVTVCWPVVSWESIYTNHPIQSFSFFLSSSQHSSLPLYLYHLSALHIRLILLCGDRPPFEAHLLHPLLPFPSAPPQT